MSYNFTLKNMSEFINCFSNENNIMVDFPNDIGFINTQKQNITEDILLLKTKTLTNEKIILHTHSQIHGLVINLVLNGQTHYIDNSSKKEENLKKNSSCIKYINDYDTSTVLNKNSNSIGIIIKDKFIEQNLSGILNLDMDNLSNITLKNQISKNIHLANDLYNSPFEGELQNIYLQSKVLELIYNEFSEMLNLEQDEKNKKVKLNQDDIEALHKAKDIILVNQEFLDLVTLSKKVALNQFKLKYGFRQLFDTSPGNMILEQKMLHAKKLLEISEYSIAEISTFVGYKYQQNFTTAFTKFFAIRPKDVMKTRNYYY